MAGINNNKDKEPLPEIPMPLLNDPRPAPDSDQVVSAFKVREDGEREGIDWETGEDHYF
jgi:hypothetical protein